MPFLYKFTLGKKEGRASILGAGEVASIKYHDIFDYPLNSSELIKWTVGKEACDFSPDDSPEIEEENGYFFLKGKKRSVYKRALKERISERKSKIAKSAAALLKHLPTVKLIAVTGALAMKNVGEEADIDLLVITRKGCLWTTRLLSYLVLKIANYAIRRPNNGNGRNKLCLNIWLDDSVLTWPENDRNIYTAHEIAQITPLINKDKTYEKFLYENSWIVHYWPNAVRVQSTKRMHHSVGKIQTRNVPSTKYCVRRTWLENFAFKVQYAYMKKKITREIITPTRAVFHPQDWAEVVIRRFYR